MSQGEEFDLQQMSTQQIDDFVNEKPTQECREALPTVKEQRVALGVGQSEHGLARLQSRLEARCAGEGSTRSDPIQVGEEDDEVVEEEGEDYGFENAIDSPGEENEMEREGHDNCSGACQDGSPGQRSAGKRPLQADDHGGARKKTHLWVSASQKDCQQQTLTQAVRGAGVAGGGGGRGGTIIYFSDSLPQSLLDSLPQSLPGSFQQSW